MGMTVINKDSPLSYCDVTAAVLHLKLNKEETAFQNS